MELSVIADSSGQPITELRLEVRHLSTLLHHENNEAGVQLWARTGGPPR